MIEVAAVIDSVGRPIYWHHPPENRMGAIPDSRNLWDVLWENRNIILGVAHTHPWTGIPVASSTDVTTFAAVEAGLGRSLLWPIVSLDAECTYIKVPQAGVFAPSSSGDIFLGVSPFWEETKRKLRLLSQFEGEADD